jgi:hypothetical protein
MLQWPRSVSIVVLTVTLILISRPGIGVIVRPDVLARPTLNLCAVISLSMEDQSHGTKTIRMQITSTTDEERPTSLRHRFIHSELDHGEWCACIKMISTEWQMPPALSAGANHRPKGHSGQSKTRRMPRQLHVAWAPFCVHHGVDAS